MIVEGAGQACAGSKHQLAAQQMQLTQRWTVVRMTQRQEATFLPLKQNVYPLIKRT